MACRPHLKCNTVEIALQVTQVGLLYKVLLGREGKGRTWRRRQHLRWALHDGPRASHRPRARVAHLVATTAAGERTGPDTGRQLYGLAGWSGASRTASGAMTRRRSGVRFPHGPQPETPGQPPTGTLAPRASGGPGTQTGTLRCQTRLPASVTGSLPPADDHGTQL